MATFLWYDYESHDADPMYARPVSFAGIRTDINLDPIGNPIQVLFRPANDFLPSPHALLVHRISISHLQQVGLPEVKGAHIIYNEKTAADTINIGFNTAKFDAKLTHALFHRNLLPQYKWHTANNSRFDIHDLVRLVAAVEPATFEIPRREDGTPLMTLEAMAKSNNIEHEAHDAVSDVRATIALAKRIKQTHLDIWDYSLSMRTPRNLMFELNPASKQIFLHAASYYGGDRAYVAPVLPMGVMPSDKNAMIVVDLAKPLDQLFALSADELRKLMFTKKEDLPEGTIRPPLHTIRLNASPILMPLRRLSDPRLANAGFMRNACESAAQAIHREPSLFSKFVAAFGREPFAEGDGEDLDDQIYGGGFPHDEDVNEMLRLLQLGPQAAAAATPSFRGTKYRSLHDRLVARNYPALMGPDRQRIWDGLRLDFIHGRKRRNGLTLANFSSDLAQARARATEQNDHDGLSLLSDLEQYVVKLLKPQV